MNLFRNIATACQARRNCQESGNVEWESRWAAYLDRIEKEYLPSGSGFDAGTTIDREKSGPNRLVFLTSFHHMNEDGCYDGWTEHTVTVRPTFDGPDIRVSGRNRNDIKDYIADVFHDLNSYSVLFNA